MESLRTRQKTRRRTSSTVLAAAIRRWVIDDRFPAGSRLPAWDALLQEFGVSRNTLVRAMEQLKQQRFICAQSTRGTFVTDRPPYVRHYALLFHDQTGHGNWSRFHWVLANQAAEMQARGDCRITVRDGISNERNCEAHMRLMHEVATDQYAGVIFVGHPERISTACLELATLPKVAICRPSEMLASIPSVDIDRDSFVNKALDFLLARGRCRIAAISHYTDKVLAGLADAVRTRGLDYRPHWFLPAIATSPQSANPIVRLLLSAGQPDAPDALIVANDNLVDEAVAAVVAMGRRVPDELEIVAHCNWPTANGYVVPMHRLGYDTRWMLGECARIIDQWPAGRKTPVNVRAPALFEAEL